MTGIAACIAVNRLGLGARPGELAAAGADPRGWALAQLGAPAPLPPALAGLPAAQAIMAGMLLPLEQAEPGGRQDLRRQLRQIWRREALARLQVQVGTDRPLPERLTAFWANHLTVSIERPRVTGLAGAFEREVIRPHLLGRFRDMLLAAARHPAMLLYLDNARSIGPGSTIGLRRGRGLNENYARELLELHTLGVDGGYRQQDVAALARILTGWSIADGGRHEAGTFLFRAAAHEPGAKTLLGRSYDGGRVEGERALAALAAHPATARHLAARLARHLVADRPPPALVERLARVYLESDGDLGLLTRALVQDDACWQAPLAKLKTPQELLVSTWRALGHEQVPDDALAQLQTLGQRPFAAPSPAGWEDGAGAWGGSEALLLRAEWAMRQARAGSGAAPPAELLAATIGPVAGAATRSAVLRAPSATMATALLLAAPEFQRR